MKEKDKKLKNKDFEKKVNIKKHKNKTKKHKYKAKKALLKDAFKEIKTTYKRFISILLMALLGVGFFAGLRATSPDMLDTIDKYFKEQNVYDIEVISTLGLTDDDIQAISNIENVGEVYGTYSKDGLIKLEEKELVTKILCIDDVNKPKLVSGNLPQNDNECVVERSFLETSNKQIGDTIEVEPEEEKVVGQDENNQEYLNNKTLKIVGTVDSPLYISRERGTSKLGSGQIDSYIYVTRGNINSIVYTEIYVTLENSDKYETSSNKYEKYVEETKEEIEEIKEERQQARYNSLINDANKKIEDAEKEFNEEKQNGESQIKDAETQIQNGKNEIETYEKEILSQEQNANSKFASAQAQLDSAENQIQVQEANLKNTKYSTNKQIANAKAQIETSKAELQKSEEELNTKKAEFNQKIQEAEGKLIDAKEEVAKIENPVWYILDRNQNAGYSSFIQDTKSIENLSFVFPIVFFAIAILVSLTSMTRMVEEERQEIGTLKALGYNKFHIALKYIIYSSLACVIGGVIGMNIGFQLLPRVIWDMYEMMYTMPSISISFNYENATIGLDLMYICIVGATLYSILKEVRNAPATLLRPKAPKIGKRVLLERITPIWKRLNFSRKVTIRNIFRYKKRFLMTVIGIFGCTSLILAGFGLKDSISKILPYQYENIFNYDMQIAIKSTLEDTQKQSLVEELKTKDGVQEVTESYIVSGTASKNSRRRCTNNSS